MKIIYRYVNGGVKNYMKEDHRSDILNFAVAKRKPEKNFMLVPYITGMLFLQIIHLILSVFNQCFTRC